MKKSIVNLPDTNAIIRDLIKDDLNQYATAEAFFTQVLNGAKKAIILEGVLVECIYILRALKNTPTLSFPRRRESRRS